MTRFKIIIFYQNSPKIKLFLTKKMQNFQALGAPPPDPVPPTAEGFALRPPKQSPPLQISGYAPGNFALFIITCIFVAFALSSFF